MTSLPDTSNALAALRHLTIEEVEHRLAELDGERAALSLLRRSMIARRRVQNRAKQRFPCQSEDRHDG
jgi:hypothetical protein